MITIESFLLSVLDQSPLAAAIYNSSDLTIVYANQGMLDLWYVDRSIVGKTFGSCFPNFEKEGFASILRNVWNTGITYRGSQVPAIIKMDDKQVKRYFDFEYKAIVDESGQTVAILHTAIDVTEQKLAKNRLEKQREEVSLSNKINQLAVTLAHDLKNPLTVLKLGSDFLIKNEGTSLISRKQWYKNFLDSIQSIQYIINQTLQLDKVRGKISVTESIAMDKKIAVCINEVKMNYPDQEMEFRLGNLYALYADKGTVYQIFANLISNAVKYASKDTKAFLYIHSERIGKQVVYFLEDNGIGIPENEMLKIFDLQVRGSNASHRKGSGIGLALVKDLMEFIGGDMNISSELGQGTVVRLSFPDSFTDT